MLRCWKGALRERVQCAASHGTAPMTTVVHVVPHDGIGGVETAARSMGGASGEVTFHRLYIAGEPEGGTGPFVHSGGRASANDLRSHVAAASIALRLKPDVLVCSLWRSCLVGLIVKCLRPGTKLVQFIHSTRAVHPVDALCNWLLIALASAVWTDSRSTLQSRVPRRVQDRARAISFLTGRQPPVTKENPRPLFIFWGRLNRHKGLEHCIAIFRALAHRHAGARYVLIGPDGGEMERIRALCAAAGLGGQVEFAGPMDREAIFTRAGEASFYLQASLFEGMAMSVVEAMQCGLVPVVTPVGEIANYCRDGENAILITDTEQAVERIEALLSDPDAFAGLRRNAIATWETRPLYRDSVLEACRALVAPDGGGGGRP